MKRSSHELALKKWAVLFAAVLSACFVVSLCAGILAAAHRTQTHGPSLTTVQIEIEKQRQRLASPEPEERRDAVTRLGSIGRSDASRVALSALSDPAAIVRATAAQAVLSLPSDQSAEALIPLLGDADEFVRREVAYALGKTKSRSATNPLIKLLSEDKKQSVRGAAAVGLGQIGDEAAVVPLAQLLAIQQSSTGKSNKKNRRQNPFLLRAVAHSLGQIRSRAAVPALIATLEDQDAENDIKREAVIALGLIGDPAAVPALRALEVTLDPYLSFAAHQALRKISLLAPETSAQKPIPPS